jgi:protein ImuB
VSRDFSPRVMAASERDVLVDISGLGRLIGPPDEIARQLAHALFDAGLAASVAIGRTQTIARLLATQLPEYPISRFPDLPVPLLREVELVPPGMNERDRLRPYETLQRWGVERLGDLAALPAADLSSRLGRRGAALQQLARGSDLRPFVPDRETRRFVERLELEWPIDSLEPLSFVLARLLEPLSDALERADRGAVAIRLELRLTDRSTCTRVLPLPVPMRDARVLRTLVLLALESNPPAPLCGFGETGVPGAAIDVVSIELDPAPARIVRFSLLDRALPSPETLATLTARLSALVGESRVGSAALLDSHAPDAFEMRRFNPETRDLPASAKATAGPPKLSEGEKVAATGTQVPAPALRRQRHPPAIRVAVERGRPVHIASSERGIPYGAIAEAAGPWRTSGGWWTTQGARGGGLSQGAGWNSACGSWNKDEWDVALKSGAVCRIYQDRSTERWFLEGIYD